MADSFLDFITKGTGQGVGATAVGRQALLRQRPIIEPAVAVAQPATPIALAEQPTENIGSGVPILPGDDTGQRLPDFSAKLPEATAQSSLHLGYQPSMGGPFVDVGQQAQDMIGDAKGPDRLVLPSREDTPNFIPGRQARDVLGAAALNDRLDEFNQPTTPADIFKSEPSTNPDVQAIFNQGTPMSATDLNDAWSKRIVDWEGRRDKAGNLQVYSLPANDGGGRYEVAGINDKYHPEAFARISKLPAAQREQAAADYIRQYTDPVTKWTDDQNLQGALRDLAFNRGVGGAAKILQMAVGTDVDGKVGPKTKAALANAMQDKAALGTSLRQAREQYENRVAGARPNLRKGLVNRWDNWLNFYNENLAA